MGKLNELTLRHNRFVQNMNVIISLSIESVDTSLINMNKNQMLHSKDSNDNPLIHKQTGSQYLSLLYAIRTNKSKPDLYLTGDFQRAMFLDVNENNLTWFIDSQDWKSGILTENYGNGIFGIPKDRQSEAKKLTGTAFNNSYKRMVLNK
jgi:hypothetical protein